ncbi:MAG: nuclease [Rhodobacteraceae bacterium]|nr:nuclease [Paracoccaceae bacterium]
MPILKTRMIFISHAWRYSQHYEKIVEWFDEAPNFIWKNCSVPSTNGLSDKSSKGLMEGMTRQINPSQVVLVLGGMYAAHSDWIEYEISEADRMSKPIVCVKPWGQERIPKIVQDASWCNPVGWNSHSIVSAVRLYSN